MKINPVATAFNKPATSKQSFGCGKCEKNIEALIKKGATAVASREWHSNRMTSEMQALAKQGMKNGGVHTKAAENVGQEIIKFRSDFINLLNRSTEKLRNR